MTPAPNPWITRPTIIRSRFGENVLIRLPIMNIISEIEMLKAVRPLRLAIG